jgi:hypothetical protein
VRILKELRVEIMEVRILKDLARLGADVRVDSKGVREAGKARLSEVRILKGLEAWSAQVQEGKDLW